MGAQSIRGLFATLVAASAILSPAGGALAAFPTTVVGVECSPDLGSIFHAQGHVPTPNLVQLSPTQTRTKSTSCHIVGTFNVPPGLVAMLSDAGVLEALVKAGLATNWIEFSNSTTLTIGPGTILVGPYQTATYFVPSGQTDLNENKHQENFVQIVMDDDSPAANAISGSLHATVPNALLDDSGAFMEQLLSHGTGAAMFTPEPMAYFGDAMSSPAADRATAFAGGQQHADLDIGAWFGLLPRTSTYAANAGNFGFVTSGAAFAGGVDRDEGALHYGVAFSLEGTTVVQQTTTDSAGVGTARIGAYAGYDVQNWTVTAAAALGLHRIDTKRLSFLTTPVTASYGAATGSVGVEAVGSYDVGDALFEPLAGLVFTAAAIDAFTETGPLAIAGQAAVTRSLQVYTGGRLSTAITDAHGWVWTPEVRARVSYDAINDPRAVTANFVGVPAPFILNGISPSPLAVKLGTGLTVGVSDRFELALNYDATLRGAAVTHSASAAAHGRF